MNPNESNSLIRRTDGLSINAGAELLPTGGVVRLSQAWTAGCISSVENQLVQQEHFRRPLVA